MDGTWPPAEAPFAWHLGDEFSGLRSAREAVGEPASRILVGILDTGFDPNHATRPQHVRLDLAMNFTDDGEPSDATDPASTAPFSNPGHGTATLALLAGNRINPRNFPHFSEFLGGAPHVDVVPIRIADSVVHFRTSAMAAGIEYAAQIGCQVLSISMGGVPSAAWADAVNRAYEAGVTIFAAAGNRIGPLPPSTLVYPARFERVVAVCGFTASKEPYYLPGLHRKMHGCFGPESAMKHAIAAYTPNIPWAAIGCGELVNPDGAGTSSATPQAAAAAALWLQQNRLDVAPLWKRVEAVRQAMFQSADRSLPAGNAYFGNGLLRGRNMLNVPFIASLQPSAVAEVSFPWLRLLGALEAAPTAAVPGTQQMFETEALQLYLTSQRLQALTGNADPHRDGLDAGTLTKLLEEISGHANASMSLKSRAQQLLRSRATGGGASLVIETTAAGNNTPPSPRVSSYESASRLFRQGGTLESLPDPGQAFAKSFRAIHDAARKSIGNPHRRHEKIAELAQAMQALKSEFHDVEPGVMASPPNRLASILQTVLADRAARSAHTAGLEFTFDETDMHSVMDEVLSRLENRPKHPPLRPDSSRPDRIGETVRIGLVGDFGTGLYGAPVIAATIAADPGRFDLLVHLGDVYYTGEPREVQTRLLDIWPRRPDSINRALNGNHDMYSGGYGYFDLLLPRFGQKSSYFSMQNRSWTLLFLDTAYKDNDIGRKQLKWIHKAVKKAGDRKIALFSHHPLFSNFKKPGKRLAAALSELLEARCITAWYWGHEHHCVVYDRHPEYGFLARCLGNGGMPAARKDIGDCPVEREVEGLLWRRITSDLTPPGLILDGPNADIRESPDKYLPHSFATIELSGNHLRESIFSPHGKRLYSGEIA
jgi:3',5'-cyclic AMP phosphodiesterase CpdA